ncbi:MAG: insulinase family protein [Leptospiraceae bacterium]|nr:insulinase family protein [Leptospiraceae bacterium]
MKISKLFILFLLTYFSFTLLADDKVEPGRFVKDIKIKELKFDIPKVKPEEISKDIILYSEYQDEFPIVDIEIHFYSGESSADKVPKELPIILGDSWKYGGSKKLMDEKLVGKIESLGGRIGVSVEFDKTIISISYLSREEDEVLELLEDFILTPAFTETAIVNAKKKLSESIHRRNERTESVGFRKVKESIFKGYNKGVPYSIESLDKVTKESILEFYEDMIKSRKKAIVLTGKFNKEKTISKLKSILSIEENRDSGFAEEVISLEKLKKDFELIKLDPILVQKDVNQSMVIKYGILPPHNHKDFFAIQLLNYIIGGGGFNSYFMQKIREEKGLAYSAASYPVFEKSYGIIYFYTLTKNESLKEATSIMEEILSENTFSKITEKELEDAKSSIINQFIFLFTNKHSILSNQLGFDEDEMPENYLEIYRDKIKSVTLEDLQRIGKTYFENKNLKSLFISSKDNLEKIFPGKSQIDPEDSLRD